MAHWSQQSERGSALALRVAISIFRLLGRRVCRILLYPIIFYFYLSSKKARKVSVQFLQRAKNISAPKGLLQQASLQVLSFRHFLNFGRAWVDKLAAWCGSLNVSNFTFEGKSDLRALLDQKRGAVVLSAHLGNIEVLRSLSAELNSVTVNALMFTKHNPQFNAVLSNLNPNASLRLIEVDQANPALIVELQERIRCGEIVALLADRVPPGSLDKTIALPFLGMEANFPTGPFILASLLECPVFLVFCLESEGGKYHVYFERFSEGLQLPRNKRQECLHEVVSGFASRLAFYCQKYPLQWFNFFDFWGGGMGTKCSEPEASSPQIKSA